MRYKIGTASRLIGLSPEGLRLYERRGMIKAEKDDTGIRYYGALDLTALVRCRSYRSYGFSMNETADLMNEKSLDKIVSMYRERESALDDEIFLLQKKQQYLRSIRETVQSIPNDYHVCRIAKTIPMYRFVYMKNGELCLNQKEQEQFEGWMEHVPFSALCITWDRAEFLSGRTSYTASLVVPKEYADALHYDLSAPAEFLPERKCVYTISSEGNDTFDCNTCMDYARDYLKEQQLTLSDDPYCRTFLSNDRGGNYTRWREMWYPIK